MSSDQFFGSECRYHPYNQRMGPYTPIILDTRFQAPLQFVANTGSDLFPGNFMGLGCPGPFLDAENDRGARHDSQQVGTTLKNPHDFLAQAPWVIQDRNTGRLLTGTKPERPADLMLWVFATKAAAEARVKEFADQDVSLISFANPPAFAAFLKNIARQNVTVIGLSDGTETIKIYPIQEAIEKSV